MSTRAAGIAEEVFNSTRIAEMNSDPRSIAIGLTLTTEKITTAILFLISQDSVKQALALENAKAAKFQKVISNLEKLKAEIEIKGGPEVDVLETQINNLKATTEDISGALASLITSDLTSSLNAYASSIESPSTYTQQSLSLIAALVFEDTYVAGRFSDANQVALKFNSVLSYMDSFQDELSSGAIKTAVASAHAAIKAEHEKIYVPGVGLV